MSSRIPYGTPVTAETLSLVEQGESILRTMGFLQFRVRFHGDLARIEIAPEELPRALQPEMMAVMNECFRKIGFAYVTLDLQGYRQGSLNEALKKK
ncbi:MAG: hypothetical protein HY046_13875 [Acidobacteria bacterium]|nr:hypothetical protein [Acidobacteriota bacterium]